MIRIHRLKQKADIFKYLDDKRTAKIAIQRNENHKFVDPNICKVMVYYVVGVTQLNNMFADFKSYTSTEQYFALSVADRAVIIKVPYYKPEGFIKESILNKLFEIETRNNIKLPIPKHIRTACEELRSW